jgi:hypothetical protein
MANYVQQQSIGDVIRNTFAVYGKGVLVIFLSYFLPVLPFGICANEAQAANLTGLYWLILLCSFPISLFASATITVSVSDICLGNAPSLVRSYKKVFGVMLKLLGTNILQVIIILFFFLIGLVPAIIALELLGAGVFQRIIMFIGLIPGIIAMMWLMFTPSAVILEGVSGFSALKRSKQLAHGYNWRNFGVFLLLLIILVVIGFIIGAVVGVILVLLLPVATHALLFRLLYAVMNSIGATITLTMIVLLYYDLRARKEAYDAAALAEDLRR